MHVISSDIRVDGGKKSNRFAAAHEGLINQRRESVDHYISHRQLFATNQKRLQSAWKVDRTNGDDAPEEPPWKIRRKQRTC